MEDFFLTFGVCIIVKPVFCIICTFSVHCKLAASGPNSALVRTCSFQAAGLYCKLIICLYVTFLYNEVGRHIAIKFQFYKMKNAREIIFFYETTFINFQHCKNHNILLEFKNDNLDVKTHLKTKDLSGVSYILLPQSIQNFLRI